MKVAVYWTAKYYHYGVLRTLCSVSYGNYVLTVVYCVVCVYAV
jgi:hypothetical protein